jgi:hypothetical protein
MVLYDPMERPLLQLVMSHPATNKKLFPRRAPRWAQDVTELSDAQLRSCHAFAQYGINQLRGVTGTTTYQGREISEAAAKVARDYPAKGTGQFGGMTPKERRQQRYNDAEERMDKLERVMKDRGIASGRSRVRTDDGPRTDGGRDVDEPEREA